MDLSALADGFVSATDGAPLLSLEGITRRFGSVLALDAATLVVRAGSIHAILGENGAGQTTLLRAAFGMMQPDSGTVRWRGSATRIDSPAAALARGIGMVHQHFTLVPAMTVAENVALGGHGAFHPNAAAARVREISARAGLELDPDARIDTLSVGAQQRCEIVKALAREVDLLILDEPTAVLAPSEAAELLAWMRRYANDGHAVVLITHKLRDALAIADDVTVLRRGRTVLAAIASGTSEAELATAMLGEERAELHLVRTRDGGVRTRDSSDRTRDSSVGAPIVPGGGAEGATPRVVIAARNICVRDARGIERVRDATLSVHAGEIVGIAAVEGAGQHQLLRVLSGRLQPDAGSLTIPDTIGFVPEDRQHDALLLDAPLYENIALRGAAVRRGRIAWGVVREATRRIIAHNDVRTVHETVDARTLSGGNQQKLVLGRELADAPQAVIVENPSRGLDFRATAAVHAALREAKSAGAAVVLYSSDFDEVLLLADRVYAMHGGRLRETAADRDTAGRAILGSEPV